MEIRIEYCVKWGYAPRAVGLTERILEEFEHRIDGVVVVPSGGGVFEIDLGGERVYSKKATGKHPDFDRLMAELRARIP